MAEPGEKRVGVINNVIPGGPTKYWVTSPSLYDTRFYWAIVPDNMKVHKNQVVMFQWTYRDKSNDYYWHVVPMKGTDEEEKETGVFNSRPA